MRFRSLIFINKKSKVIVLKRYLMKKNRMSKIKFKKIMKKEIKLMIPTKKLKSIWMEWTKLMKKTWKEKKEKNKSK